jgi:hypothetical protein
MFLKRFVLFSTVVGVALLFGLGSAGSGLQLCSPAALPGDEIWTRWQHVYQAVQLVFSSSRASSNPDCFTGSLFGSALIQVSSRTLPAILAVALLFAAWLVLGPSIHQWWFRQWGKHTIVAGEPEAIREVARQARHQGGVAFLAVNQDHLERLRRQFWLSLIEPIYAPENVAHVLDRIGCGKAQDVIAASTSDVANIEISRAAIQLANPGASRRPNIVTLIEQAGLRNLRAHELAQDASARNVELTVVSLGQMQIRQGIKLAIPYQSKIVAARRVHVIVSGSGLLLLPLAMQIMRQAYELRSQKPMVTIVRFGNDNFSEAAVERIKSATLAADIRVISGDASDDAGFERAIGQVGFDQYPIFAIHCIEGNDGEAEVLARRWEKTLRQFGQEVPPIAIYPSAAAPDTKALPAGGSGMWRWSPLIQIATARGFASTIDRHARAIHDDFIDQERKKYGAKFPTQFSHAAWPDLPAEFQDDNRAVADHFDTKLMMIGCRTADGADLPAYELTAEEIELLSAVEHARWMAGKSLNGWKYGKERNDQQRLHPSMMDYDSLSEAEKQKDRNNIIIMPRQLALVNKRVVRDFACGIVIANDPTRSDRFESLISPLLDWPGRNPGRYPVIWITLDFARAASLAEALIRAGLSIGIVHGGAGGIAGVNSLDPDRLRLARIMKSADRHLIFAKDERLNAASGERHHHYQSCDALVIENDIDPMPPHRTIATWDSQRGIADASWLV